MWLAAWGISRFATRPARGSAPHPGVTLLKPLKGDEGGLYANLSSFIEASRENVQLIFGVRDRTDPAAAIVERLAREHPERDLTLVVDGRVHGQNPKVSNLLNMLDLARHDLLVFSDSDVRVGPGYLEAVTAPLEDEAVGLVTCLYLGRSEGDLWSRLGALWVNYAFLPSVLVAQGLGVGNGCFGATLALRRRTLDAIGGLHPLRDLLADDYALGAAVRASGKRVVVCPQLVEIVVSEKTAARLISHEIRWLRTIRSIEPWGYAGMLVTHPLVLGLLGLALAPATPQAWAVIALALASRLHLVARVDRAFGLKVPPLWTLILRDFLSFGLFLATFTGSRVAWRDQSFRVARDGTLVHDEGAS